MIFFWFNSYQKAIDKADVVILTTTPGFRPLHFKYAIDNDKHVFMEKPVATDAAGVRQVLNSAKIATKKKLRDAPAASAITNASNITQLKAAWDTTNLGTNPYS